MSENGRYRVPNDNPFVKTKGARPEIWAYGLRNPHRLAWGPDPSDPRGAKLIANSVGYRTWETVNIIERGANHGWPYREGNQVLSPDQRSHGALPEIDKIPTQVGDEISDDVVTPKYPVIQYGHDAVGGDAIGSGYIYNGKRIPELRGKYIFGDITTGRFWFADYKEMLAADADGNAGTLAKYYDVKFAWDNPSDSPDAGTQVFDTTFPINELTYHARGGKEEHLASRQRVANQGRADARFAIDHEGELYVYSKSDGMIRQVVGSFKKMRLASAACMFVVSVAALAALPPSPTSLTLELKDVASLPITGKLDGAGQVDGMLARVNSIREEPGGADRWFVTDMNGPIYVLDKKTKALDTYLDFNGAGERPGLFDRLYHDPGYSSGISQFQFDPDYRRNGRFYTVHMESPVLPGSQRPDTTSVPGLTVGPFGYEPTAAVATPGPITYESVLVEWTDTNIRNTTFEGTAREVLRVQLNHRIHPMGELVFHPTARRGDPEWRVMYIGHGDGGSGELRTVARPNPQRLDTLVGKILRIIPDSRSTLPPAH